MNKILYLFGLSVMVCIVGLAQTVYHVNAATGNNTTGTGSIGNPFKTITKALTVSVVDGDSIKVASGTYDMTLGETFPVEMLSGRKLIGTAGAGKTIINASGSNNRVFNCVNNSASTVIQGFTITGGFAKDTSSYGVVSKGGGLYIDGGSPIIKNNIITANIARGYDFYQAGVGANNGGTANGGGIYITSGTPTIQNNVISNNSAHAGGGKDYRGGWSGNGSDGGNASGGGIYAGSSAAIIINNTIIGNSAKGGLGGSSNSLNAGNGGNAIGGGITSSFDAIIKNNIFSDNSATGGTVGGGSNGSNGTAADGALSYFQGVNFSYNLYYNNIAATNPDGANLGTNNKIGQDPLFVSQTNFHLQALSPARKAGTTTGAPSTDFDGTIRTNPPAIGAFDGSGVTSLDDENIHTPFVFHLEQNFPNPFNPATMINYQLPMTNHVTLKVYDAIGREVATLVNEVIEAGSYSTSFDGSKLSSGIYFAKLQSGNSVKLKKMILLK